MILIEVKNSTIVEKGVTSEQLASLSPETREIFLKYSGRLISLGQELLERDNFLMIKNNQGVTG